MVAVRRLGLLLLAYQIIMMCPYERKFCVNFFKKFRRYSIFYIRLKCPLTPQNLEFGIMAHVKACVNMSHYLLESVQ